MGAEAAHSWYGAQFATGLGGDADDFIVGRARLGHPMYEEIPLLEGREERLPEKGQDGQADQHEATEGQERRAGCANDAPEGRVVAAVQPAQERGLTPLEGCFA